MDENTRFTLLFLGFLGRQRASLGSDRFGELLVWGAGALLTPEFFRDFPEFQPWRDKGTGWWRQAVDELRRESERGRHFILRGEAAYPGAYLRLPDPPHVLSLLGHPQALREPLLAVVGAREPRGPSVQWMDEHLAALLERLPLGVVSGGARGVDQAAHRIALRAARPTVVVLPSGLAHPYPSDMREWALPVCEAGGAFLSEFHPRTPMRKWNFQIRNRLIAGLGFANLVIEARLRSGTWMTARLALEAGRNLGCLPGPSWDPAFGGNLELIEQGAQMIRDAQDLVIFVSREWAGTATGPLDLEAQAGVVH